MAANDFLPILLVILILYSHELTGNIILPTSSFSTICYCLRLRFSRAAFYLLFLEFLFIGRVGLGKTTWPGMLDLITYVKVISCDYYFCTLIADSSVDFGGTTLTEVIKASNGTCSPEFSASNSWVY